MHGGTVMVRSVTRPVPALWCGLLLWMLMAVDGTTWAASEAAEPGAKRWSVSPLLGVAGPRLRLLNEGEFAASLPGRGRITLPVTGDNVDYDFIIDNPLKPIDWGSNAGIEFQLLLDRRHSLLFGFSVWEGGSTSTVSTEIPFQGGLTPTLYERSGKISYFEYYVGYRRNLFGKPRKYRVYGKVLLRELFDIDYEERFVFSFAGGPNETFKRNVVVESQATGVLMLEGALGSEYFFYDWLSVGMDLGYSYGFGRFRLGDASRRNDIQANDNIRFKLPAILGDDRKLKYLWRAAPFDDDPSYERDNYRPLKLKFDGWRLLVRVNFYF